MLTTRAAVGAGGGNSDEFSAVPNFATGEAAMIVFGTGGVGSVFEVGCAENIFVLATRGAAAGGGGKSVAMLLISGLFVDEASLTGPVGTGGTCPVVETG